MVHFFLLNPGGPLECQGGYQARPKIHIIRVVFQDRHCTRVHCLGVQKRAKLETGVCFWSIDKFWKDMTDKLRKMHAKTRI